jgi:hypothetical protein
VRSPTINTTIFGMITYEPWNKVWQENQDKTKITVLPENVVVLQDVLYMAHLAKDQHT